MLDVVTFKWAKPGYRSCFTAQHVNILFRMVQAHYAKPFRFNCVTDDAVGIDADIRVVPLWNDHANVPSPHGGRFPSCYRRLKLFSRDAEQLFGPVILSIDLDVVLVRDVTAMWDRPEDFVIVAGATAPWRRQPYNGSMMRIRAGSRAKVWDQFDPKTSPLKAFRAGCRGSDQGWIAYCLGPNEATWDNSHGFYSYRNTLRPNGGALPDDARIVNFHGKHDPWGPEAQRLSWVRQNYNIHDMAIEAA